MNTDFTLHFFVFYVQIMFLKCNSIKSNKNQDFISYVLFYFYINTFLLYVGYIIYNGYEPQISLYFSLVLFWLY